MGLLKWLTGAGTVKETLEGVGKLAQDIRSALTGELPPEKRAELTQKLAEIEGKIREGQIEINKIEASSGKLYIAGWRPAVGWVCAFALLWNYILFPFLGWALKVWATGEVSEIPQLNSGDLMALLLSLLGFGGMRSFEKFKGVEHRR